MKYKVVVAFKDLKDNSHLYRVGDEYPREGVKLDESRAKELSSPKNLANCVLIKAVEEAIVEDTPIENAEYTRTEINKFSTAKLKEIAKELGLDDSLSGNKLKPLIMEKLGL